MRSGGIEMTDPLLDDCIASEREVIEWLKAELERFANGCLTFHKKIGEGEFVDQTEKWVGILVVELASHEEALAKLIKERNDKTWE
jgi:hypothetical protein